MRKKGSALTAFVLVTAFVWLVFDNLALALLFGLFFAGSAASLPAKKQDKKA